MNSATLARRTGGLNRTASILPMIGLVAAIGLAGCAATTNSQLATAGQSVNAAKSDPTVQKYASAELTAAQQALDQGQTALAAGADKAEVDHLAYITSQRVEIAKVDAGQRAGQTQLQDKLAALNAQPTSRGLVVTLGDVLFDTGKSTLNPGGLDRVDRVAQALVADPAKQVLIEGHTDSTGGAMLNLGLSQQRADAVRERLIVEGVPANRVTARGFGEDTPVASNGTAAGRQQNRRVELVIQDTAARTAARG